MPLCLFAAGEYSIVFIHIGKKVPDHAEISLSQARLFNPSCPIILLANETAINKLSGSQKLKNSNITYITCESLNFSDVHKVFVDETVLNSDWRNGFWRYTSERFLYLADLMQQYDLTNVFHLEYDNMLYADLSDLLPLFENNYKGIAATFDNEVRCVPGFMYFKSTESIIDLANCFAKNASSGKNDMEMIGLYKRESKHNKIDNLPIIHFKYMLKNRIFGKSKQKLKNKYEFCSHIDQFDSIFDAAALGQYLGGIDPRNGESKPGFINESCIFDPSTLTFMWEQNDKGLWVPYAIYYKEKRRINNLHIHSKNLEPFSSLVPQKSLVVVN